MRGGSGANAISGGGSGADAISGGGSNDRFYGGIGGIDRDSLSDGSGIDFCNDGENKEGCEKK